MLISRSAWYFKFYFWYFQTELGVEISTGYRDCCCVFVKKLEKNIANKGNGTGLKSQIGNFSNKATAYILTWKTGPINALWPLADKTQTTFDMHMHESSSAGKLSASVKI